MQALAQPSLFDSVNTRRYQITKAGFTILGSWAALNIVSGLIGQNNTAGEQKQFHNANITGGFVNMAFAGIGYLSSRRVAAKSHNLAETYKRQAEAEKLFLFSVGLDIGVLAFGAYTKEKANRFAGEKRERLKGAGSALLLQGGFLMLFDGMQYLLHNKNGKRLTKSMGALSLSVGGNGAGLVYRF